MSDIKEKRMIGNSAYEVKQAFPINGKEILLAEDPKAENGQYYLVCRYKENGIIGEYSKGETSDDYLEILQLFTSNINKEIAEIQEKREILNLPPDIFTAEHCYPRDYSESIENKVVVIKAEVFSPEYRSGDYQLVWVVNGNGAAANPRGNAVYCYHLNNGEHTRFERYEVLGVIRPEAMPVWAKNSLERLQSEKDKPVSKKQYAGKYEIIERIEVGNKIFVLGHNPGAVQPYGTWYGYKNSSRGFDMGRYTDTYENAKSDLHTRAGEEQKRIDSPKRNEPDR